MAKNVRQAGLFAAAVCASLIFTGCGGGESDEAGERSFEEAVDAGASCEELFEIRNGWDPKSPRIEPANEVLRSIGCYSASSERTDQ